MRVIRLIRLELIKIRWTGLFWLLTGGTVAVNISFAVLAHLLPQDLGVSSPTSDWTSWISFHYQGILGLLLPMFLVIICALSNLLEERNETWKLLHTLPVSKSDLYLSKVLALILSFVSAHMAFLVLMVLLPILTALPFSLIELPVAMVGRLFIITVATSLPIIGLMFLVSYISRLFIVPLLVGIMGFVLAQFLYDFELTHSYFPFAFPIFGLGYFDEYGTVPVAMITISLLYFGSFLTAGLVLAGKWVKVK